MVSELLEIGMYKQRSSRQMTVITESTTLEEIINDTILLTAQVYTHAISTLTPFTESFPKDLQEVSSPWPSLTQHFTTTILTHHPSPAFLPKYFPRPSLPLVQDPRDILLDLISCHASERWRLPRQVFEKADGVYGDEY